MPKGLCCAKCGAELSAFATEGFCSACLLEQGLASETAAVPSQLSRFGDYELIDEIARGGMGVVYKARQLSLERIVAVKLLLFGPMANADTIRRFRVEAVAAGSLQHPNIVAIHEVGIHNDQHFLVMDYVDGPNLAKFVHGQSLPPKRAAAYVKTIADAIHYAHERGILHRDLKPSNVLIDSHDQPRVTDFGLARRLDGDSSLTLTGQVIGSPNYMPPEQAAGRCSRSCVSLRSDVYGLGAILYHLLTGRPPFQGESITDTLHQVLNNEPISPRLLNPSVPFDLQTIGLKALQKEPNHRYPTAMEFAAELARFLNEEPIHGRPVSHVERLWRWCRRKPALSTVLMVAIAAIATSAFFSLQARHAEERRLEERRQNAVDKALMTAWTGDLESTEEAIRQAELDGASLADGRMLRGLLAFHRGENDEAIRQLDHALKLSPQSITIRSMLARAHVNLGQLAVAESVIQPLGRYPMNTAEDHLFKGLLEEFWDPERALQTMDGAVRKRPTGFARLIRGQTRTSRAQDTGRINDVEAAVSDAVAARTLLPDSPVVLSVSLRAHLVAAGIYEENRMLEKSRMSWCQAADDLLHLQRYPNHHDAMMAQAWFVKEAGDDWSDLEKLNPGNEKLHNPLVTYFKILGLYRGGRFREALDALGDAVDNDSLGETVRGYVLVELPGGSELALKHFRQQWAADPSLLRGMYYQTMLRLMGRKEDAVIACRQLRQKTATSSAWRAAWYHRLLDYNCDFLSENELLRAAGDSKWNQCEAHYSIALTRLSVGDRVGACEHFRKAIAARVFDFVEHEWSRAFLARMNQDPNWPPWIPQK